MSAAQSASNPAPYLAHQDKRRRQVITPEGLALPFTVATRMSRAGALILDFVIIYGSMLVFFLLLIWVAGGLLNGNLDDATVSGAGEFLVVIVIALLFLARYGYFLMFELGPRGATPGKRAAGIRVAARDGGRLTTEAVIARNLLRDIELFMPIVFLLQAPSGAMGAAGIAATAWFLTFMLLPFFNKDAMRAGDIVAGTWVVEAPKAKLQDTMSTAEAAHGTSGLTGAQYKFGDAELSVYGEYELQTLERVLREDRAEAIAAVAETICRKIGWNPGSGDERAFLEAFYNQLRARLEGGMRFGQRKSNKFS